MKLKNVDRFSIKEKAKEVSQMENLLAVYDSLILCKFSRGLFSLQDIANLMKWVTGFDYNKSDVLKIGSEIEQGETHNNSLTEVINIIRADIEKERSATIKIKDQWSALNQELDNHKKNLMDLTAQEAQYKNIYQNASNNKESLKRRLKNTEEETRMANKRAAKTKEQESKAKNNLMRFFFILISPL